MNGTAYDLRERAERLRSERQPFVTATVVRAERPTSAKAGDSALVLGDGTVIGFVGGECAHTSVQVQALASLRTGDPVLLRITPDADALGDTEHGAGVVAGTVTVHNPCLSGGALEIFLEPSMPPSLVVVHGDAPIARAVRELASWLGYDARPLGEEIPPDADAVVIASHGGSERVVIEQALRAGVPYIGLIASPRRGRAVLSDLALGVLEKARMHTPAGLDIGCRTPEEVALSVLAEIVSVRPRAERSRQSAADADGADGAAGSDASAGLAHPARDGPVATDPVCGMSVAALPSSLHCDHDEERYFFCGSGCEQVFRADPESFARR